MAFKSTTLNRRQSTDDNRALAQLHCTPVNISVIFFAPTICPLSSTSFYRQQPPPQPCITTLSLSRFYSVFLTVSTLSPRLQSSDHYAAPVPPSTVSDLDNTVCANASSIAMNAFFSSGNELRRWRNSSDTQPKLPSGGSNLFLQRHLSPIRHQPRVPMHTVVTRTKVPRWQAIFARFFCFPHESSISTSVLMLCDIRSERLHLIVERTQQRSCLPYVHLMTYSSACASSNAITCTSPLSRYRYSPASERRPSFLTKVKKIVTGKK